MRAFQDKFEKGCIPLEVGMIKRFCKQHRNLRGAAIRELDLSSSTKLRLETILQWLQPAPCSGFAELLLDNSVHQVSLCIASDAERLQFVQDFRVRFHKQYVIASKVQAFWLSRLCPDDDLVQEFARTGHVCSKGVKWIYQAEIYELCRRIVPQHISGIDESEGQHLSTMQELEACTDLVRTKCVDLLQRMSQTPPVAPAETPAETGRIAPRTRVRPKPAPLVSPVFKMQEAQLEFADKFFDF